MYLAFFELTCAFNFSLLRGLDRHMRISSESINLIGENQPMGINTTNPSLISKNDRGCRLAWSRL